MVLNDVVLIFLLFFPAKNCVEIYYLLLKKVKLVIKKSVKLNNLADYTHRKGKIMKKTNYIIIAAVLIVIIVAGTFTGIYLSNHSTSPATSSTGLAGTAGVTGTASSNGVIKIVAAENFWGSLVSQLGGTKVNVTSIVSDPNTDPHEYESNAADAIAIANAQFVIVNGAGYDTWALQLIAASASSNQVVLNVQELINQTIDANPHFWYSPYYVNDTVAEMYKILCTIEPSATSYFTQQYQILKAGIGPNDISLGVYNARIDEIKQQFAGMKVGINREHLCISGKRHAVLTSCLLQHSWKQSLKETIPQRRASCSSIISLQMELSLCWSTMNKR